MDSLAQTSFAGYAYIAGLRGGSLRGKTMAELKTHAQMFDYGFGIAWSASITLDPGDNLILISLYESLSENESRERKDLGPREVMTLDEKCASEVQRVWRKDGGIAWSTAPLVDLTWATRELQVSNPRAHAHIVDVT